MHLHRVVRGAETPQDTHYPVCDGNCGYAPTIVVPGIFQSQSRMYDDDGNVVLDADGRPLTQLMVNLTKGDIVKIAFKSIVPLLSTLLFQADRGLSKTVASIASGRPQRKRQGHKRQPHQQHRN